MKKISILRRVEEIESVRGFWAKMQWNPNADVDMYLQLLKANIEKISPFVVVLTEDGSTQAMLVGRIEASRLAFNIGYLSFRPKMKFLAFMYGGVLGSLSDSQCELVITELLNFLRSGEVDVLFFNHLHVDSRLYDRLRKAPPYLCRDHFPVTTTHWATETFDSYQHFYDSRSQNTRHNLRRYAKLIPKQFGSNFLVACFRDTGDIDTFVSDVEKVASKTYHRRLGVGFVDSPEFRERISFWLGLGWYRAYLLYIEGAPSAFWTGVRYGNTFFTSETGYDPLLEEYRPGTYLFIKMIEGLSAEGVTKIDFGFGDAQYKRNYCDQNWLEGSPYVFAPSPKSILINSMRTFMALLSTLANSALAKADMLQKAKTWWRRRLIKGTAG